MSDIISLSSDDNCFLRNDYVIDKKDIDPGLETLLNLTMRMELGQSENNLEPQKLLGIINILRKKLRSMSLKTLVN